MIKQKRLRALRNQVARLERRLTDLHTLSNRFSWFRVGLFLAGLFFSLAAFYALDLWFFWLILLSSLAIFIAVVRPHRRVDDQIQRHAIWLEIKQAQIARMTLDWAGLPEKKEKSFSRPANPQHPFESDINLVGHYSLLRVMDTCVSEEGSERLYEWLSAPVPDVAAIETRHALVDELIERATWRSRLILAARLAAGHNHDKNKNKPWQAGKLQTWINESHLATPSVGVILFLTGLACVNAFLFVLYWFNLASVWWFVGSFFLYMLIFVIKSNDNADIFHEAVELQQNLKQLGAVSDVLETYSYANTPHLKVLCSPFLDAQHRPSRYLKRMNRIMTAIGLQQNPYLGFALNALLPWHLYCVYALSLYKQDLAPHIPLWLDRWFELEALSALANLAYVNPTYILPTILGGGQDGQIPVFHALALGHPLIPDDQNVKNNFTVPNVGQICLITGSNMAGKSSFLRTLALNLALAYAGGPVCADQLTTIPFRLFTSINVTDSVTDGISYFYAEVKRLKLLLLELEREHPYPLIFFIDEIFRGTNNRERLLGSQSYIRALAGQSGVGFVSTHDLDLVNLADQIPQIKNYHFREQVIDQQMVFDYTLREGPCPTTNALKIMELEGLPVHQPSPHPRK